MWNTAFNPHSNYYCVKNFLLNIKRVTVFGLVEPVQVELKHSLDISNAVTDVNYKPLYVITAALCKGMNVPEHLSEHANLSARAILFFMCLFTLSLEQSWPFMEGNHKYSSLHTCSL